MIGSRKPRDIVAWPQALAEDAHQLVVRLGQSIQQGVGLSDPAQAYFLMGVLGQLTTSLRDDLNYLSQWWDQHAYELAVTEGPFAGDPGAAITTTIASLTQASAACTNLTLALERAQICTSDLAQRPNINPDSH